MAATGVSFAAVAASAKATRSLRLPGREPSTFIRSFARVAKLPVTTGLVPSFFYPIDLANQALDATVQKTQTLRLTTVLEKLLLEIEIQRQGSRQLE